MAVFVLVRATPLASRFHPMSKGSVQFTNPDILTSRPALLVPGSLDSDEFRILLDTLGSRTVTWVIEESVKLPATIESAIESHGGSGVAFSRSDSNLAGVGAKILKSLGDDGIAVFLPGEVAARPGTYLQIPGATLAAIGSLGIAVQPLAVHHPHEVSLKVLQNPSAAQSLMTLCPLIPSSAASSGSIRQALMAADEQAFSNRPFLKTSLPEALIAGLKEHGKSNALYDGVDDSTLSYSKILGAAIALSKKIKSETRKQRVGVILPPGKGGLVANLAVLFAGKIPVNLNFTASHSAVRSAIRQADIDRFITADPFVRKVPAFPWPANRELIFIERVLPQIKKRVIRWVILGKLLPKKWLVKMLGLGKRSGDDEAMLLFTSGSSGEPKGVSLSHRNLLANVCQFGTRISLGKDASILGSLPLFHSFGCTVTLLYPVLEGVDLVTYPSPLDAKRLGELIEKHKITLLLSTPTFLRGFMRRVEPEQLAPLELVVTGAEKLPDSVAQAFEKRFNILPMEGYGLTETSPATNVNIPTPQDDGNRPIIPSRRFRSVGCLLPGLAARMTNVVTEKPAPITESGILWLKGPNVFQGYLNRDDLTKKVFDDGWFCTGDVARFDDDGFLFIEGRISRFSKIGGEMVPHEAVEEAITKVLGLEQEDERKIAIVGVPDEKKGEALILLSTVASATLEQENIDLRYKLLDEGIPALWCPRAIVPTDEIPTLASGKLDIKGCSELATASDGKSD